MKLPILMSVLLSISVNALSQSIMSPNYGLKSPQTAEVVKVDFSEKSTIVWISVTSDINNAYFCIDRNTWLVKPDGTRLKVLKLDGLPWCPATYRFKRPGETAPFSMVFQATGVLPWFSIVEECSGGCLSVRGIITDKALNDKFDMAYSFSDKGEDSTAYNLLKEIISETDSLNLGIEGSVYTSLILIDHKLGREKSARSWYNSMMTSDTPDLGLYLETLRRQGVSY